GARHPRRARDEVHDGGGRRHPLVLGPELRPEDGRGPRHRDDDPGDSDPDGGLRSRVRRAVRPRARDHACDGTGGDAARGRQADRGAEGVAGTAPEQAEQYPAHFEPPRGSTWRLFFGPGLVRGAWMAVLGFGLGTALVCLLRFWWGWDPVWNTQVVLLVGGMVMAPIFFLGGI